jgi:phosphatidylglycerophosphatase A
MGSFGAALVAWPLALLDIFWLLPLLAVILFFVSLPIVNRVMEESQTHDPGWIVIDEVCGQWLAYSFVPPALLCDKPWLFFAGFVLFRFFDILKPLGIRKLEALPDAWGVMADDVLGGIYAGLLLGAGYWMGYF